MRKLHRTGQREVAVGEVKSRKARAIFFTVSHFAYSGSASNTQQMRIVQVQRAAAQAAKLGEPRALQPVLDALALKQFRPLGKPLPTPSTHLK